MLAAVVVVTAAQRLFVPAAPRAVPASAPVAVVAPVAPQPALRPKDALRPAPMPPTRASVGRADRGSLITALAGDVQNPPAADEERWMTRAALVVGALALVMGIARSNAGNQVPKDTFFKDSRIQDPIPDAVLERRYHMFTPGEAIDDTTLQRSALALLAVGGSDEDRPHPVRVLVDKVLCISGFIFPVVELCTSLAGKVLLATDNPGIRRFYSKYLARLGMFYLQNVYACFAVMLVVFLTCSRGRKGLSKFVRFNVIQAVLMSIVIQCFSVCWPVVPFGIRESFVGQQIVTSFFWGAIVTIFYAILLILLGRYPRLPVISDAARLQVMRGYES